MLLKNNIVFLHLCRTGGTTLETYFNDQGLVDDRNKKYYKHHLLNDLDININFSFTIIRNPFEKVVSDFLFKKNHKWGKDHFFYNQTFDEWVDFYYKKLKELDSDKLYDLQRKTCEELRNYIQTNTLKINGKYLHCQGFIQSFLPCVNYITDQKGQLLVDFVVRHENYKSDLKKLETILNDKLKEQNLNKKVNFDKLPKLNKSIKKYNYKDYYKNPDTLKKVKELLKDDLEYFDYNFSK